VQMLIGTSVRKRRKNSITHKVVSFFYDFQSALVTCVFKFISLSGFGFVNTKKRGRIMYQNIAKYFIAVLIVGAIGALFFIEPIAQDPNYHNFIDQRMIVSIPNFWNVISNLPFLIVGFLGLKYLNQLTISKEMGVAYWLLFFGVLLVGFGSSYYHLEPNNHTLVWDRLPMTLAFMSLFAVIVSEFVNERRGAMLLIPLLVVGVFSVFYWQWTESNGVGDLRLYALVQFLPMVIIPVVLLVYPSRFSHLSAYWWLLMAYLLAKLFEYFDVQIYSFLGGVISGHSLKHAIAALGMYVLLQSYRRRKAKTA